LEWTVPSPTQFSLCTICSLSTFSFFLVYFCSFLAFVMLLVYICFYVTCEFYFYFQLSIVFKVIKEWGKGILNFITFHQSHILHFRFLLQPEEAPLSFSVVQFSTVWDKFSQLVSTWKCVILVSFLKDIFTLSRILGWGIFPWALFFKAF
jgi:hypothetical protein